MIKPKKIVNSSKKKFRIKNFSLINKDFNIDIFALYMNYSLIKSQFYLKSKFKMFHTNLNEHRLNTLKHKPYPS